MEVEARLGHNQANVIFERFGDEVVAIHLGTGCYYSLPGLAGDAFLLLHGTCTVPQLAEALSYKYDAPAHSIAIDLREFLRQLRDESLVVEVKHDNGQGINATGMFAEPRLPYAAPAVSSHRDLENLFLIDPVHDAGAEGWPHVGKTSESGKPLRYRFASERCLIERFDEAAIALNLNTGAYFSFSGPAEDMLLLLHNAPMQAEIVKALATKYVASETQLSEAVDGFLTRLIELDLVLPEELDDNDLDCRVLTLLKPGAGLPFEAPEIDVFRDAPAVQAGTGEAEPEPSLLSGKRKFRLNQEQNILAFAADGAVAVSLVRGNYFVLNSSAALVLRMLEQDAAPSEIVAALERRYVVRRPELVAAVIVLLRNFVGIGLATAEPAEKPAAEPAAAAEPIAPRILFEAFSVDLQQELRDQICLYPGSRPVTPEPASRARQLAAVLEEYFEEAGSRTPVFETRFLLAGRTLLVRCVGDSHSRHLSPALAHLRHEFTGEADLTIHVWDADTGGVPGNSLLSSYLQNLHRDWTGCCGSRGELRGFHSSEVPAFYMPGPDVMNLVDIEKKKAFFLKRDASALPYWEAGSPFRSILHTWLSASGLQFVHGGAMGDSSGGVLLAGKGGSGKSTTSLLCLNAGMLYAGDDYCAIDCGTPTLLHSLYNTAKLLPQDVERFPELRARIWNPQALAGNSPDKAVVFLADLMPERMSLGFPLRAILIPRISAQTNTHLTPCGPAAVLAALAPSTVAQLQNTGQQDMDRLACLASGQPAYILHLGSDLAQIPGRRSQRVALESTGMTAPSITVITPVRNGMPYLRDAIRCVMDQQYSPLDMIVVDDGSEDGSGEVARSTGYCRVLRTPGVGPAAARNRGIMASESELMLFLDADDLLGHSLIHTSVDALRGAPEAGFAQACIQNFTTGPEGAVKPFDRPYRFINLGAGVWRRNVFEKVGLFDESLRFCEDLDFVMRCWENDIPKVPVDSLMFYRRHAGNMTRGLTGADRGTLRAYRKRIERIRSGEYDPNRPRSVSWPDYLGMPPDDKGVERP